MHATMLWVGAMRVDGEGARGRGELGVVGEGGGVIMQIVHVPISTLHHAGCCCCW